jgi:hypothetical protein
VITITGVKGFGNSAVDRERDDMTDSPAFIPVLLILLVTLAGSVAAFFVMPPLLDKIDRVGKIGFFGF